MECVLSMYIYMIVDCYKSNDWKMTCMDIGTHSRDFCCVPSFIPSRNYPLRSQYGAVFFRLTPAYEDFDA